MAAGDRLRTSTNPGAMIIPFTSKTVSPAAGLNGPRSEIFPSRIRMFSRDRGFPVPSMTLPLTSTRFCAKHGETRSRPIKIDLKMRMAWMLYSPAGVEPPMKITKYVRYAAGGKIVCGILDDQTIHELHGDILGGAELTGKTAKLADVKLVAPCEPSKVIAVGRNYKSHIADRNIEPAKEPGIFLKTPS